MSFEILYSSIKKEIQVTDGVGLDMGKHSLVLLLAQQLCVLYVYSASLYECTLYVVVIMAYIVCIWC